MARKTSKHNGNSNGKMRGAGAGQRKKATRPPIIDVAATEVPDAKSQAEPQAQINDFPRTMSKLWNGLLNFFSEIFSQLNNLLMGPQRLLWMSTAVGLVIIVVLYAFLSTLSYRSEPVADLQKLMQQRLDAIEKQLSGMPAQISGMRGDIAKEIALQGTRIKEQSAQFAEITDSQEELAARISTLERALQATDGQIERQLKSLVLNLETMGKKISEIQTKARNSETLLKAVQRRLVKLEIARPQSPVMNKDVSKVPTASQVMKFKTAALALIGVMQTQSGFAEALNEYTKVAPDDPAVGLLKPYADAGAPLIAQLLLRAQAFATLTDTPAPQNENSDQTGFYGKIAAWSRTIIRVRRKVDKPNDDRQQARAWMKIASHLKSKNLGAGLAIALTLPGSKAHDDWVRQAEARLLIDRQIESLKARLDAVKSANPQTRKSR